MERQQYPEAGLEKITKYLLEQIGSDKKVLNVSIEASELSKQLTNQNCSVVEMNPESDPVSKLDGLNFDVIVSYNTFHHFDLEHKVALIHELMNLLDEGKVLYIGDVSFERRLQYLNARDQKLEIWDDKAHYFVYDEIKDYLREFHY